MMAEGNSGWTAWLIRQLRKTPLYAGPAILFGQRAVITGASMYPLLHPGDRVLVDRLAFRGVTPLRGDVVLAEPSWRQGKQVKLIAGLPGERVAIAGDRLWIDGQAVTFPQPVVGSTPGEWQLGADEYFLLSYAAAVGTDSRHFGPVARNALRGRAWFVYWPPERRRRLSAVPMPVGGA